MVISVTNLVPAVDHIFSDLKAPSLPRAYRDIAMRLAETRALDAAPIYDALMAQDREQSAAIGDGLAVPHLRLAGLTRSALVFARLSQPVAAGGPDERPVDLIFALFTPEDRPAGHHLARLAGVSRMVRDKGFMDLLRHADGFDGCVALFLGKDTGLKAA